MQKAMTIMLFLNVFLSIYKYVLMYDNQHICYYNNNDDDVCDDVSLYDDVFP